MVLEKLSLVSLLLLVAVTVSAGDLHNITNVSILFDIQPDNNVRQYMNFTFLDESVDGVINYSLSDKVTDIMVFGDSQQLNFSLVEKNDTGYLLQIFLEKPVKTLSIVYSSDSIIFRSDPAYHFFTELSFEGPVKAMHVQVSLPAGQGIYRKLYTPSDATIDSDGRRIILVWDKSDVLSEIFSVKFAPLNKNDNLLFFISTSLAGSLLTLFAFSIVYFNKKNKEAFLKGFREDEQKTVKFLEQNRQSLQSRLQTEFGFSRAKATRIVMKLEEKGLVRKERFGRTNKLYWLR